MKRTSGFTLIELLITIGIIGILAAAAILVLNPAELLNRTRDSARVQDLQSVNDALKLYEVGEGSSFGAANTVYISIPDTDSGCANLTLPSLTPGYSYACATDTNLRRIDSTGWIPVDFTSISGGSPLSKLPTDPVNSDSDNLYYAYVTGASWALSALFQAERHETATNDGGPMVGVFEIGTDLTLTPPSRDMDLVGYWPMDEGSGTTTVDVSGENNIGTITGAIRAATSSCKVGRCLDFDGVNDYVNVSGLAADMSGVARFSVSLWAKADTNQIAGAAISIRKGDSDPGNLFILYPYDLSAGNGARIYFNGSSIINENGIDRTDGDYHHFVFVSGSATNHEVYVDGVSVGASSSDKTLPSPVTDIDIGRWSGSGGQVFNGSIDEVRIYNRALTAGEIEAIYNATK